ncbi:hypothetical protein FOL46_002171, partial [Perkinsus olseni]
MHGDSSPSSPSGGPADGSFDERAVFYIFDADADGRLTAEEFREALKVCGVQLTDQEFNEDVLVEFGSQPNVIIFSSAVAVCRERNLDPAVFRG